MQFLKQLWLRMHWLGRRSRFTCELRDEMQFHIESRAQELTDRGVPYAEALSRAQREFGPRLKAVEETSGAWQMQWLEDLFSDLRYAARAFLRNPGFAFTAILCLALGIGANTTIFNITTSFLFSAPSCRDSSSLIALWEGGNSSSSLADYKFIRDAHIFDGMAGINVEREVNWRAGDRTDRFYAGIVSDDFFTTLGVPLFLGRGIAPGETNTTVLSYRLWKGTFEGDPAILGRGLILDGKLFTVVGILPANNRSIVGFGISPQIYVPVQPSGDYLQLYARLPEGMTIAIARARLQTVLQQLDRTYPDPYVQRTKGTRITGVIGFDLLNQQMPGVISAFFAMLLVVVALVLLIACTNVASLLLARASSRSLELAIRLSLGASRRRIIRHLLAESLLLCTVGALAGLFIDLACAKLLDNLVLPIPVPIHLVVSPDWRLLWYALGLVLLSALLCGLLPALKAVGRDTNNSLKEEQRHTAKTWTLRSALVAGQLSVSIVLLAAGFLFVHNLLRATKMNPGFDTHHTIWAYMRLVPEQYKDPEETKQLSLVRTALDRLRALPGVESAAITRHVPFADNCVTGPHLQTDISSKAILVRYQCNNVGPDYFGTVGIPLLRGREFNSADRKGSQPVVIVNETFAHTVFGQSDPIGHTIKTDLPNDKVKLVIGIAKDSKYFTLGETQQSAVYEPYFASQEPVNLNFLIRTTGPPDAYLKPIATTLGQLDPAAAIQIKPMSKALGLALLPSQAGAVLLGATGLLGLILAAIGLYGVLLYSVSRRTREIGLRVALGATPSQVSRLIARHSLLLVGGGTFFGLTLSIFAVRPLTLFLVPGLESLDVTAFSAVVGVLGTVALLATAVPVARALRVDPMTALRYE